MNENSERDKILSVLTNPVNSEHYIRQIFSDVKDLKPSGKRFIGLCPFHTEKTPSFTVEAKDGTILYHCFGCDEKGDVFDYIAAINNLDIKRDFREVLKKLGEITGVEVNTKPLKPLDPFTAEIVKEAKKMNDAQDYKNIISDKIQEYEKRTYDDFKKEFEARFKGTYYKTGYSFLDEKIKIMPEDLVIIKGYSSHGKTSFMLNIATNILLESLDHEDDKDFPAVVYITYEASSLRIEHKIFNIINKLKGKATSKPDDLPEQTPETDIFTHFIEAKKLYIFDSSIELTTRERWEEFINELHTWTKRRLIIFIDYIQIMNLEPENSKAAGFEVMKDIAYTLEQLTVNKRITIIAGSQVNEKGNVRESRDIYHAASIVIDIFNRSHASTLTMDSSKNYQKYQESDEATGGDFVNLCIEKSKHYQTAFRENALSFDGYVFKDREKAEEKSGIK